MANTNKLVLATSRLTDSANITASSEVTSMPAANLQRFQPTDWWQTTSLGSGGQYLEVEITEVNGLGQASWNLISLLYTNATVTTEWRVRASTASLAGAVSAPTYDTGWVSHWPVASLTDWEWTHSLLWLSDPRPEPYIRIDVRDAALDFYRAGRLYIANAWQPSHHVKYGWSTGHVENQRRQFAEGGPVFPRIQPRRRVLSGRLNFLEQDEMFNNAWELDRARGVSEDVLAILDPEHATHVHRWMIYGLMKDLPPIVNEAYEVFEKSFEIEEAI